MDETVSESSAAYEDLEIQSQALATKTWQCRFK